METICLLLPTTDLFTNITNLRIAISVYPIILERSGKKTEDLLLVRISQMTMQPKLLKGKIWEYNQILMS